MKISKLLCVLLFVCTIIGCTEKESTVSVSSVSLNTATIEMVEGETFNLVATVLPKDAEYDKVIWASSNASVARVNSGTVTAIKEGITTITASAGGKSATCSVKVSTRVVAVTSITLDKTSLSMKVGETETITATVNPDNASDKSVVWGSSDVSIATVSDGKVTAKKSGTAIITAKSGSCIAECTITVSVDVESFTLDKTSLELTVGETEQLTATVKPDDATDKNVTWTSSDESVAKVDNGKVTAIKSGKATITAKCCGKTVECAVTVTVPTGAVTLDKTSLSLAVGETAQLTATVKPDNATDKNVTWTSSDESVAKVDNGYVVAVKEGEAIISASVGSVSASCKVVVINTNRVIKYTAESVVTPFNQDAFGAKIISNEYSYPNGMIIFDGPVVEIGRNAFFKCQTLKTIVIPESVSAIGGYAFYECTKLSSIKLQERVVSIGGSAFQGCFSLPDIVLPNSVTTIGADAFNGCMKLSNVVLSKNVEKIGMRAFRYTNIKTLDLPHSLRYIENYAFLACDKITNIIIPDSVVSIGGGAFYACTSLVSVDIQGGVSSLPLLCFGECPLLSTVRLPNTINKINDSVFDGCPALSNLYIKANIPPEIRNVYYVGWPTKNMSIWVPRASVDAYKEKWVQLKDNIKAYDF